MILQLERRFLTLPKENTVDCSLVDFTKKAIETYGSYTIEHRALSDFRDGLKPVHRKLLWAMYGLKLHFSGGVKKAARTIGETIGKYHPHSDQGSYSAMANLVNLPEPLIYGKGNWGDYESGPAAMRYTEASLSKYSDTYLLDPNYLAVIPMVQNYDGEHQEPVYLPSKLPNLLINGSEGIATGCSSLIPSYSLKSVLKVVKMGLKGKKITPRICAKYLEFKFPYGGECRSDKKDLLEFYTTGKGRLYFTPSYSVHENIVSIQGIAPRFNVGTKFKKLSQIKGVRSIDDKREQRKIEFDIYLQKTLKGDARKELEEKIDNALTTVLFSQTILTVRHADGEHADYKQSNIPSIINNWIRWRIALEKKVVERLVGLENDKLKRQKMFLFAIKNRKIIVKSLDEKDPKKYLMKHLKIQEELVDFILDLKVRNLARMEAKKIKEKITSFKTEIKLLKDDLKDIEGRIFIQLQKV